ncbi:MAG: carbamoyl phosphate synthase small subunit [Erysipelotrichaceae bacterium]|nr:carbamoyl phosphate synthase small subunit [Erysipelotrichaceae bacterium]
MKRKLVLENGLEYIGQGFASEKEVIATLVFNTSIVGYQEIISDPSNSGLMVCMTYPLIGNYGITDDDYESRLISLDALIVREYNDKPSNFRYTKTLSEVLEENDVVGLTHVDTRSITKVIKNEKEMLGIITDLNVSTEEALNKIKQFQISNNLISLISCKKIWYSRCSNPKYNIVIIDCGITFSIINKLNSLGCNVTIVPYNTSLEKIKSLSPDGILISSAPDNLGNINELIELVKILQEKYVLLAIGNGCDILGSANDIEVFKMKNGHRGLSNPVRDVKTNKIYNVSENHGLALKESSNVEILYRDVIDNNIEGIKINDKCFGVQFYPTDDVYNNFIEMLNTFKGDKENV